MGIALTKDEGGEVYIKIISIIISISVLFSNIGWGQIYVPEQYGSIEKSNPEPKIILIKDAHCIYEAQKNIARILETLIRDYRIDLVCMEGAEGFVDTSIFSSFPDEKVRQDITDKYIKKGYLTAPEALSIERANTLPFRIYGIEDTELYLKNFASFRDTLGDREITDRYMELINSILNQLKIKTYNKELFDFDKRANEFLENTLNLTEWVKILNNEYNAGENRDLKYFRLIIKAIILEEGIDFKAVEEERAGLLSRLERELPKEELKGLVERSLLFRLGRMSSLEYYKSFENYHTVHLRRYIHLLKLQSRIDSDKLFDEIENIETYIREGLYKDETERELDRVGKDIRILKKLFGLGLTRRELKYFKDNKALFPPSSIVPLITIQAKVYGIGMPPELTDKSFLDSAEKVIQSAEYFYELALERDNVLVENLLKRMGEENKDRAIIIVGGFHSDGIIKRLVEKGMSYTVISPKITEVQDDNPYLERMMDKRIEIAGLSPVVVMSELGRRLAGALREKIAGDMLRGYDSIEVLLGNRRLRLDRETIAKLRELFDLAGKLLVTRFLSEFNERFPKLEIIANIDNAKDLPTESLWIEMLRASLALEEKGEEEIDREIAGIVNAKRERAPPPGEMKRLGKRGDPTDEDIYIDLSGKHGEFEELAQRETHIRVFAGSRIVVVVADGLKAVGAYQFYSKNLGHYIVVVNKNTSQEIQNEGVFHEFRELLWIKNLQPIYVDEDPGYIQHLAHVIASAEQIKEYAMRDEDGNFLSLTPYHQFQLGNMTDEELESIIGEDRTWHHGVLRWAGLDVEAIIAYERRLRDTAAEELLRRQRLPYEARALNLVNGLRAGTVRPVAAIPDVHGNIGRLNQIINEIDTAGIRDLVFMGDYIDRDPNSLQVLERVKGLVETGRTTALLGNHELMFIMGMLGDDHSLFSWAFNGGVNFLKEAGIEIEGWDEAEEEKSDEDLMLWLYEELRLYRDSIRQNEILKYWAEWMLQNLRLYHIDKNGTFYVHAGLPVDEDGNLLLDYKGKRGRDALDELEKDLRDPVRRGDVFKYIGDDNEVSVVWLRNWYGVLKEDKSVDNLLRQLGALRIVVGHTVKKDIDLSSRFRGKINFIDFGMAKGYGGRGGFLVVGPRGVGIQRFEDRNDTQTKLAYTRSRDELIDDLIGPLGGQYIEATQTPGARPLSVSPVLDFVAQPERQLLEEELPSLGQTHLINPDSRRPITYNGPLKLNLMPRIVYILSYEDMAILHPLIANRLDPKDRFFLLSYLDYGEDTIGSITPISVGINHVQGLETDVIWRGGKEFIISNLRTDEEVSVGLYRVLYPEDRGMVPGLGMVPMDSRGYDGLPNDRYTPGIRDAIAKGNFRSVNVGEGLEVLDNLVKALGIQYLLEDTTIIFIPGQKAHYSVGRNQIYLDSALLDNPRELREQLVHEVIERYEVMQGLGAKGLMGELVRTSDKPERRSAMLRREIIRLAREAHRRIKDFKPFSDKGLTDEEYGLTIARYFRKDKDWGVIITILSELIRAMGGMGEEPQAEFQRLLRERFGISEWESRNIFMLFQRLSHVIKHDPTLGITMIGLDFYELINEIAKYAGVDGDILLNIIIRGVLQYQLGDRISKLGLTVDILMAERIDKKVEQSLRRKGLWEDVYNLRKLMDNIRNRRAELVDRLESPFVDAQMRIRYYHALNEGVVSTDLAGDREVRRIRANTDFPDAPTAAEEGILPAQRVSEANSLAGGIEEVFGKITEDYTTPAAINIPISSFITNWDELWRILRETRNKRQVVNYAPGLASFFNLLKTKGNKNMKVVLRMDGMDEVIEGIGSKGDIIKGLIKDAGVSENVLVGEEIRDSRGLQEERDKLSRELDIKGENIIFFTRAEELDMEPIRDQVLRNQIKVFGIDENSQLPFLLILGYMASRLDVFRDNRLSEEMTRLLSELGLGAEGELFIKIRFIRTAEILEMFKIRKAVIDIAA